MPSSIAASYLENRTFEEITTGDTASLSHRVKQRDIDLFATATGNVNPTHVDSLCAAASALHHVTIHSMWGGGLLSTVLGTKLPGPGAIYLGQDLIFVSQISIGDVITATVTVREKRAAKGVVVLDCVCTNQTGAPVITGAAIVRAPSEKVRIRQVTLPEVWIGRHDRSLAMIAKAALGAALPAAIVYPVDANSLLAALAGASAGLIVPTLIGPEPLLRRIAKDAGADLADVTILDAASPTQAAEQAVALARSGRVTLMMKGDLHTDILMHAVVAAATGLRTEKRISHVFVMDVPEYPRPLLITDAAINIAPDLMTKAAIVQNAIDLAHIIGIDQPRVAILAAVEVVNDRMRSTIDAAALCKMADRGQITGGRLDGPLAFDNAINLAAAEEKGIVSDVAGRADILLAPDLEAGNMLVKQLTFMAGAETAGLVLGAGVPIILTSRADSPGTRLTSCALAVLAARATSV